MSEKESAPYQPRWVGGKRKLLPELLARVPHTFARYHEPFMGGGALFFALQAQRPELSALLSDVNSELIVTWQVIADAGMCAALLAQLERFDAVLADVGLDAYYPVLRSMNPVGPVEIAARFIALNKLCFNGVYRVNKAGKFNVPVGSFTKLPLLANGATVFAAHCALQSATIGCMHYLNTTATHGDFVYFDPPYAPVSATSDFTAYTAAGFTLQDQMNLRDFARRLKERGVHVLLSNSAAPVIYDLYGEGDFRIEEIKAARSVNSVGDGRGKITELLIS